MCIVVTGQDPGALFFAPSFQSDQAFLLRCAHCGALEFADPGGDWAKETAFLKSPKSSRHKPCTPGRPEVKQRFCIEGACRGLSRIICSCFDQVRFIGTNCNGRAVS